MSQHSARALEPSTETETGETGRTDPHPGDRPAKTVSASRVEMTRLMRPKHANFSDNVHGGVLLELMDEAAYLCASRYAERYCVTVAVDRVAFENPVRVGDEVTLRAAVHDVGRTSMEVGISLFAEDPQEPGSRRLANRSFFTMVARGDGEEAGPVPELVCETPEDRRLRCEAQLRKDLRASFDEKLEEGMCRFEKA